MNHHNRQHRPGRYDNRPATPRVPLGPFFDDDGNLHIEWVGEKAKEFSKTINDGLHRSRRLNRTGLRNFYNEFLRIKNMPESSDEEKKIFIKLLISKAHYKKTTANLPPGFVSFIEKLINEVDDDLQRFDKACLVMEAIVGYFPES